MRGLDSVESRTVIWLLFVGTLKAGEMRPWIAVLPCLLLLALAEDVISSEEDETLKVGERDQPNKKSCQEICAETYSVQEVIQYRLLSFTFVYYVEIISFT